MKTVSALLDEIQTLMNHGPDLQGTKHILSLLGCPIPREFSLEDLHLYSEYLPKGADHPFWKDDRFLHFLWDAFDRSLLSLSMNIAFPFRRMIATRLFSACGKNFNSEGDVRFNFGQFLSVGDDVFLNRGSYFDTKGILKIGNGVGIGEFVRIFTHNHSESDHTKRIYSPVVIGEYAKIFAGAMILPGVTIGPQSIVAGGAVVTKDVSPNTIVAGVPARPIRDRHNEGKLGKELRHIWLYNGVFQDE
jgi:acetyltransferase-like isoleucine patch superfamily enzyme